MFDLTSIFSQLLFNTVKINTKTADGKTSTGTGFFFHFKHGSSEVPVLITNKHVVSGSVQGSFSIHKSIVDENGKASPSEESFNIVFDEGFHQQWFFHPEEDVDLCLMPFAPLKKKSIETCNADPFYICLNESQLPTEETLKCFSALEEITMIGYPIGLWDTHHNLPLIRRGITSSHPKTDFNNRPIGVLDIAAFPGSSGSPVLIINEGSHSSPKGLTLANRVILLGALFAGPKFTNEGTIEIVEIPTHTVPVAKMDVLVHLGYYIKSSQISELKKHFFKAHSLKEDGDDDLS